MTNFDEELDLGKAFRKLITIRNKMEESKDFAEASKVQERLISMLLKKQQQDKANTSEDSLLDMHNKLLDEAEQYLKKHAGEHTLFCKNCNTVLIANMPHWALVDVNGQPHVFSPELDELVQKGRITLKEMAFVLRTSEEGILRTKKLREGKDGVPEEEGVEDDEL